MTKSSAATRLLALHPDADLVICAGNDRTDEEMFEALLRAGRPRAVICRVGSRSTLGQYFVETPGELFRQLEQLTRLWSRQAAAVPAPGILLAAPIEPAAAVPPPAAAAAASPDAAIGALERPDLATDG
jgi:hypothetical protein